MMVRPLKISSTVATLLPWLLALGLAAPLVASAQTTDEDMVVPETLQTRDTLGGDWGEMRSALGQHGIRFDLWTTGYTQAMFQGTGDNGWDVGGRVDLLLDADLWQGGGFHTHIEYRTGNVPGERDGSILPVHVGGHFAIDSEDDLVATSLYLSQRFGESTRVMLGRINVIDLVARHPFYGGWGTDRFQSVAFVIPPNGITPAVIKGAILSHSFAPYAFTAMVFDPNDRSPTGSIGDLFDNLFGNGVTTSLGMSWSGELAHRRSGAGIAAVYSTAEGIDYRELGQPQENGEPATKSGTYNLMIEGSHLLVESTIAPGQGLGVYVRTAVADGNPNLVQSSVVAGIAGHSLIPGRPNDYFGAGYYYYNFSDELQNVLRPARQFENEQGTEVFYVYVPMPWLRLSAHLQWVDPAAGANESIWLGSVRMRVAF